MTKRRSGFTLVELLVAAGLMVFVMAILAEAFGESVKTFRGLKAIADMNSKLRTASTILRRELDADHFEGRKRMSDPDFWAEGPPRQGFFRVYQGSPSVSEGTPLDGVNSYTSTNHALHFTVKLRGNDRGGQFMAFVPPGSPLLSPNLGLPEGRFQDVSAYSYQWAEVAYFLTRQGQDTANGTPLYALHRRQRLAVPDNNLVGNVPATEAQYYGEVSYSPSASGASLYFNSPIDLTVPQHRFGGLPGGYLPISASAQAGQAGSDVVLTDVISFNVRVLFDRLANFQDFVDLHDIENQPGQMVPLPDRYTPHHPNFSALNGLRVFDTWSQHQDNLVDYSTWRSTGLITSVPILASPLPGPGSANVYRIKAIQVTIRVWDLRTEQARQVTIVQDL